jgi:hypothetical protein
MRQGRVAEYCVAERRRPATDCRVGMPEFGVQRGRTDTKIVPTIRDASALVARK